MGLSSVNLELSSGNLGLELNLYAVFNVFLEVERSSNWVMTLRWFLLLDVIFLCWD